MRGAFYRFFAAFRAAPRRIALRVVASVPP